MNTYAYVRGNPINYSDPLGLRTCKGKWVQVGWNRVYNILCQCVWLCVSCDNPPMWSGNPNSPGLPRTMGTLTYNAHKKGKDFDPKSGNDCSCVNKPGPEEPCVECEK